MDQQIMQQLKRQLEQELQEIERRLEESERPQATELSNYDNHPADNASDLTDQLTEMAMDEHLGDNAEEIKKALQAMADGTYGKCVVCGEDIPLGRLEAMPQALTCVEHAEQKEENLRPVEEDVLSSTPRSDDFIELEEFGSSDTPQDKI
ncbi:MULTISPECIES: TraR/DksA C4-type zinc finger protein [unclassified Lysinibacillus]|uniref:TraR/DksA C4-type zinc finger protein n=1 Tax=unclassified Lysinibacillus TaxID=2636778 RepID=UPI000883F8DD|nr:MULTISPECIES: TraR/DksA C4-type zinc finger protein [unclassified Lysinibacillus]SCZ02703.1 transcriptional regulator, TraR/DksA family [Lysinibacillus sp. SG9]SDB27766.1 transcriptional regulator, TraR/DksA family [Lysinibacillus sp. TC-37]SFS88042.1 transcriptional regulator, TraR/DksA family [Lysinibacillus sp. SG55]